MPYVKNFVDAHGFRRDKKKEIVASIFVYAYSYVLSRMIGELRAEAQRAALEVGQDTGAIRNWHQWLIRELLCQAQGKLLRLVRRFEMNRACYGSAGLTLFSVTYEPHQRIYRILGRRVGVRARF